MMKVTSKDKFNTSFGTTFIISEEYFPLNVGEMINIDGNDYRIKKIMFQTTPNGNLVAIIV